MGARRVIWHVGFERLLRRLGPRSFEVRSEVRLSDEPQRIDYLLLRKRLSDGEVLDDSAGTLRRLWPMLPQVSVVEYKSPSHPYRPGNLDRLWSYIHAYFARERELPRHRADGTPLVPGAAGAPEIFSRAELCAVLIVPSRTPSLLEDVAGIGFSWEDLGGGYWRAGGLCFTLYVVEVDVVGPGEADGLLSSMGHGKLTTAESRRFWMELMGSKEAAMSVQDMEGYEEMLVELLKALPEQRLAGLFEALPPQQRLAGLLETLPPEQILAHYAPEQRVAGLPPEQRLAGLPPEQRLAGLPPEQRVAGLPPEQRLTDLDRDHQALALPIEVLHLLPEEYFRSLSPEVEAELRRRLTQNGH